jgi:hypothetical protein
MCSFHQIFGPFSLISDSRASLYGPTVFFFHCFILSPTMGAVGVHKATVWGKNILEDSDSAEKNTGSPQQSDDDLIIMYKIHTAVFKRMP